MSASSQPETSRGRCARAAWLAPVVLLLASLILTAPALARTDESPDAATTESSAESTTEAPGTGPEAEAGEYSESMLVVAERADRRSTGATGLDLEILETPQSISVISSELMDDFAVDELNDALRLAPGINVEEWETNRTNYMARGFDIVNTQVDGVGMPNDWGIVTGANDSFGYEKLEVIRGANGQLTGVGNASGTINFVRKRPTNEQQGEVNLKLGSWGNQRVEADWSTPLTSSGSWAGRLIAAYEDGESYLQLLQDDRMFLYGVVDGQLGERSTLSIGYTFQDANTDGNLWGGLPFAQSDGTQAEFPRDATTSQDWTRWDTENQNGFVELGHQLGGDWFLKATYNYRQYEEMSRLFYSWSETGIDPQTGEGVLGYPGNYGGDVESHLGELSASGKYTAFGRSHQAVVGVAVSRSTSVWNTADPDPYEVVMPGFPYPGDVVPEPVWGPAYVYDESRQEMRRAFGATGLSLTDRLTAILGVNYTWFHREGESIYDTEPYEQEQGKASPYAGLTFAFSDRFLAYASYSDIYQPQDQRDIDYNWLEPTQGVNFEAGVKAEWLDRRLLTTLALFSAEQKGLSTLAGYTLPDFVYYYEGVDVDSRGFELEATGRLSDNVDLVVGYTALKLTGADGEESYPWTPRRTVTLALGFQLPALPQVRFGLSGRWQSEVSNFDDAVVAEIRQGSYGVLGVSAEWKVNERLSLQVNVDNLTDEKFIGSVYYVGYYGAPLGGSIGLHWRF